LHPHRGFIQIRRIAASLEKSDTSEQLTEQNLKALAMLTGSSDFFAEIISANPGLISTLGKASESYLRRDYRAILRSAIDAETSFAAELAAFRLRWAELITGIGELDATNKTSVFETNRAQTELAVASINVAFLIGRREMARRYGRLQAGPRMAFLGLGRLGTGGMDYGSDLDLLISYDSLVPSPISSLTQDEAYARLAELVITALSSITREGYLYRVDVRLRPHGKNGPLVTSAEGFLDYLREESAPWEWLAYLKLRAVGGDLELGRMIETHARHRIHQTALRSNIDDLKNEAKRVRERLEHEKGGRGKHDLVDIKYGPGGMLDVYFATRYLQLRDEIADEGDDRSTAFTLERLRGEGSLTEDDFSALSSGYSLLRSIDHQLRLLVGRSTRLPDPDHTSAMDVAKKLGFESGYALRETLVDQMKAIRNAYNNILK